MECSEVGKNGSEWYVLLGTIKVGDEITVDFDFVLERVK